jgi:hypothetical protein
VYFFWRQSGKEWTPPCLNPGRGCRVSLVIWVFITHEGVGLWGHYYLGTHNYHLGMTCNNGPNKVINDFNIFVALILPSTTVKVPTPSWVMNTQITKLTRQPRPGFKHGGVHSFPDCRQKKYTIVHSQNFDSC